MPKPLTQESLVQKCEEYLSLFHPREQETIRGCKQKVDRGIDLTDDDIDTLSDLAERY